MNDKRVFHSCCIVGIPGVQSSAHLVPQHRDLDSGSRLREFCEFMASHNHDDLQCFLWASIFSAENESNSPPKAVITVHQHPHV